jgi:16S rRNA (guanine(966)-N(2))-methyltransferase RsmD
MRIIAGTAKGRILRSLRGQVLRPTPDRVRESLFGVLGEQVVGAVFADLYAGVGSVGLEALSRGAEQAVFVESHAPAVRLIVENAARCGLGERIRVIRARVTRALPRLAQQGVVFDLVFLDPPYGVGEVAEAMAALARLPSLVAAGGWVVCQRSRREELEERIGCLARKRQSRFGETVLDFYTCAPVGAAGG